ncbi:peptidoglycan-binding domain-containing protein [Bradyrhizobium sp. SZCCHNS2002]|uniref:peptidoglycan-binding domain-containing protein n=1 Tax=Bradyrhizobium sp. SZCCHNS2002 TaxID=3057302 RepID=UPI002915C729|nr:peptidoglycan-binding domain-containing protein [Bradyrhizobium sp. SZCCHNS2002]
MVTQIGGCTDASTAEHRDDVAGSEVASFRYNNPGCQYPSARAARFGQTGYGIIGGDHKIARFPSPVNGAASNFDLLSRSYVGMKIGEAGTKWTGAHGFGVPGYDPDSLLTREIVENPAQAIPLLKAIADRESGKGNNLSEEQWRQAHKMFKAGSADAYLESLPTRVEIQLPPGGGPSGAGLLKRALEHIGEPYVNRLVPKDDPNWHGPWDCAEFISWLVYQEANTLYGCVDDAAAPAKADAYTGAWKSDLERLGKRVSVEEAAATVGGIVLRYPPGSGRMGHIAICDGKGGTVEAKGQRYGVVVDTVHGRGWHAGILIPGITYGTAQPIKVNPPAIVYAIDAPNMDKAVITRIQEALAAKGFDPGVIDGEFGPNTQTAVVQFQQAEGMVVDGAVGPETAAALGVSFIAEKPETVARVPDRGLAFLPPEARQLLTLILMLLWKEKPMAADPAKSGQGLELLLPLLLQSALTGKQLDVTQFLAILATGKPLVTPSPNTVPTSITNTVPAPVVQAQPQAPQAPADLIAVLVPMLYERLTGKAWPGTDQKIDAPANPNAPVLSRSSVQLSTGALGIVTILQALGKIGLPFNLGSLANLSPDQSTTIGTISTLIPLVVGAVGATGGWGALASVGAKLLGGIIGAFGKKG